MVPEGGGYFRGDLFGMEKDEKTLIRLQYNF